MVDGMTFFGGNIPRRKLILKKKFQFPLQGKREGRLLVQNKSRTQLKIKPEKNDETTEKCDEK
jgi:hypothetical protein